MSEFNGRHMKKFNQGWSVGLWLKLGWITEHRFKLIVCNFCVRIEGRRSARVAGVLTNSTPLICIHLNQLQFGADLMTRWDLIKIEQHRALSTSASINSRSVIVKCRSGINLVNKLKPIFVASKWECVPPYCAYFARPARTKCILKINYELHSKILWRECIFGIERKFSIAISGTRTVKIV